ncbi:carboxymuconolactone decarboxylase family protein [Irregularibacter muris]|uniref:Carboxymuconolactone decarboxylase family protein n=1 Tax=Irregularibacter muris TaxID=1796619 RepID=A0AAE3KZ92_9FIRM|nr:carboxymuconolactone decarboxylase family protein [Irregularibacter muris]MCR1897902.1 carboxymuconolactone decarboxylase family protein [Irregularibacter muris]
MKDRYIENRDIIEGNLEYIHDKHSDIYQAYKEYGKLIHTKGGPLDEKTRWLIKVAISTVCQYQYSVVTHIKKASDAGCTREEIEHAILLTAPSAGFPTMMEALLALRREMKEEEK